MARKLLSIVIPVYNESLIIKSLYEETSAVLHKTKYDWELIFVDDGSTDDSAAVLSNLCKKHASQIKLIALTRNFGKEIALTAGLHAATGDAVIMMDSDLQHPPRYLPQFIAKWESGSDVVVGVRKDDGESNPIKLIGSRVFNWIMNKIGDVPFVAGATDFRLLDRAVADEFSRFTERNRITRGLIDWLGFKREYIEFEADKRLAGERTYGFVALIKLARDSLVSLSLVPLRISGYLGVLIVILTGPLGIFMLTDKYLLTNRFDFTSTAALSVLLMFMVGVVLINLGLISLYIATIHREVGNRPLYVIKKQQR